MQSVVCICALMEFTIQLPATVKLWVTETATVALYHIKSWGRCLEQFGNPYCLINAPQWPHRLCCSLSWLDSVGKRLSIKVDLAIIRSYVYIVTVSGVAHALTYLKFATVQQAQIHSIKTGLKYFYGHLNLVK